MLVKRIHPRRAGDSQPPTSSSKATPCRFSTKVHLRPAGSCNALALFDILASLGVEAAANGAVKPDPDPEWGSLSPQDLGSSTGVRLNGFFVFEIDDLWPAERQSVLV